MEADEVIYAIAMGLMLVSCMFAWFIDQWWSLWVALLLMTISSGIKGLLWQHSYYRSAI